MSISNDANIGLGEHVLYIDLTGSEKALLDGLSATPPTSVRAVIYDDLHAEVLREFEASGPPSETEPPAGDDPVLFRRQAVNSAGMGELRVYLRLKFKFTVRGDHLIVIMIDGTTAETPLRIGVGDGLPEGTEYNGL